MDAQAEATPAGTPDFSDLLEGVITTIPLDRLMLSTLNVRQTERAADVDSLAEDIAARGLKQNLVVVPAHFTSAERDVPWEGEDRWADRFEVIAGGRRFQAMQLLVQQERLSATFPVPCMVEFRDEAAETSLSENLHRVAMNPADEFEAFRVIVDQAKRKGTGEDPIAYCAKRFGVTVKHVQGRLRLATLAPEILSALRNNVIGIESAKAYAGVEDHELQLKVFVDQCKPNTWKPHDPANVRAALRGVTVGLKDPRVLFVGLDAYRSAGGRTEVEMFMGTDGEERVTEIKLLDKLAKEKAEPLVAPQAKKDGFKSGLLGSFEKWPKAPDGMVRHYDYYGEKPTKAQLKKCVAVYAIAHDGVGIQKMGHYKPEEVREQQPTRDYEAERIERERAGAIDRRAAQLAAYDFGQFKGTPLEGRAFWPVSYVNPVRLDTDEAFSMVAVLIRVPTASIEAHRGEAEQLIDEEAAAAEAAKQAAAEHGDAADVTTEEDAD